jgi:hypothetical protein
MPAGKKVINPDLQQGHCTAFPFRTIRSKLSRNLLGENTRLRLTINRLNTYAINLIQVKNIKIFINKETTALKVRFS